MPNDFYPQDDDNGYTKTVALCVAAASLVVLVFLVILYINSDNKKKTEKQSVENVQEVTEDDFLAEAHNFTSDELDFWNEGEQVDVEAEPTGIPIPYKKGNTKKAEELTDDTEEFDDSDSDDEDYDDSDNEESLNKKLDDDIDVDDENHITVIDEKGNKKYYEILPEVSKCEYDLDKYLENRGGIVKYKDDKRESVCGVDLSSYNGDVDFKKVKESGIDFAMLRLGSRGYSTGAIALDEKFVDYAQNAALNGINIGAYFYSQAMTESEAVEEANYTVGAVGGFNVKYPIVIVMEKVNEKDSRTSKLTVKERTAIAKTFCDTVKNYGLTPCISADRDMLITGLNMEELDSYDIWLRDSNIPTDYPYTFSLWQYAKTGRVDGVNGDCNINLSFKRFEQK